jgi:hypothetical protein
MDTSQEPRPVDMHVRYFYKALSVDYSSAVRADTTKQNFKVCPRHWYVDATFACSDCGREFGFSAEEQRYWFEELRFYVDSQATRCPACRKQRRAKYDAPMSHSNDGPA